MIIRCVTLLVVWQLPCLVTSVRVPQNPCPDVFSYYKNSRGDFYGEANVPYDGSTRLTFSVNASFAALFENRKLKLELANPPRDSSTRTLKYYIYFPFNNILPKITQITYNDRIYCSGPPEPLIPGGSGVTNVWSSHIYQYYTGYSPNYSPGNYDPPVRVDSSEEDSSNSGDDIPVKDPIFNTVQGPNSIEYQFTTRRPTKPIPAETPATAPPRPVVTPARPATTSTTASVDIDYDIFKPDSSSSSLDLTPTDIRDIEDIQCGVPTSGGVIPLILGGTQTQQGQYPWLAALFVYTESTSAYGYKCTANLISQKHVITAAHCVQFYKIQIVSTENILVVMGTNDLNHWATNGAVTRGATKVTVNEGFMNNPKSADADLAVITMNKPVAYTNVVRPICLWNSTSSIEPLIDKRGMLAGWGTVDEENSDKLHTEISHHVELPIVSQFECLKADPAFRNITSEKTFCAGDRSGSGPCVGDSGAGFVVPMNGAYFLRGVASLTVKVKGKCALREKYAVFCDVAKYKNWVESVMTS